MKRIHQISIAGVDGNGSLDRAKIVVTPGKKLGGIRIRVTAWVGNSSGAGIALSSTDRDKIVDHSIASLTHKYGSDDDTRVPMNLLTGSKLRLVQRAITGVDVNGWTNATTGLARTITASTANVAVVFTFILPFTRPWWLSDKDELGIFGMGPTQAKTVQLEIKRGPTVTGMTANLSIGTNAFTYDILPDEIDSPEGDVWSEVPHYLEKDEAGQTATGPVGLPFLVIDRNAAHAATAITEYALKIGGQSIHENAQPSWVRDAELDYILFPTSADVGDTATVLYRARPGDELVRLPSGPYFVDQPKVDVATLKIGCFYVPPNDETRAEKTAVAIAELRKEPVKTIGHSAYVGKSVPDGAAPFLPTVIKASSNSHFHKTPGLMAAPGAKIAVPHIPEHIAATASARLANVEAKSDPKTASHELRGVSKALAKAFPGGMRLDGEVSSRMAPVLSSLKK